MGTASVDYKWYTHYCYGTVAMFKRNRLWHRDRIYSDEGFFVLPGKDWLVYCERGRRMTITVDGFAIYRDTIGRWDDDLMNRVDEDERARIGENVRRALESQGQSVTFI